MKALSVRQPWATMIAQGSKTIETRDWPTKHRGPLLICSSREPKVRNLPSGKALCVVNLVDCRPMTIEDEPAARCRWYNGAWAWVLTEVQSVEPFGVVGQLGLFDVHLPGESEQ